MRLEDGPKCDQNIQLIRVRYMYIFYYIFSIFYYFCFREVFIYIIVCYHISMFQVFLLLLTFSVQPLHNGPENLPVILLLFLKMALKLKHIELWTDIS
jgi:hypothetical protein